MPPKKGKGKTALKNDPVKKKLIFGDKIQLIQASQKERCSKDSCNKLFGKNQMVVKFDNRFFCSWACSWQVSA